MTPQAPVGAPRKLSLPFAISVAVLTLGATACGTPPPQPTPDGGCTSPCFPVQEGDGGFECVCAA